MNLLSGHLHINIIRHIECLLKFKNLKLMTNFVFLLLSGGGECESV